MVYNKYLRYIFFLASVITPLSLSSQADSEDDDDKYDAYYDSRVGEIDNFDFLYPELYGGAVDFAAAEEIISEAYKHLGKPYRSGNSGPRSFDCSGFTNYVFRQSGIRLNRSSRSQYLQGSVVARDDLKRGDLVFWTGHRRGGVVGHVGIVVDVDRSTGSFTFIHASSTGVKVDDSREPYYSNRYVGARRVTGVE